MGLEAGSKYVRVLAGPGSARHHVVLKSTRPVMLVYLGAGKKKVS